MAAPPLGQVIAGAPVTVTLPPSAPAEPAGPVTPCDPVSPLSPLSPLGPCGPMGPADPVAPEGPAGPRSPLSTSSVHEKSVSGGPTTGAVARYALPPKTTMSFVAYV